MTSGLPPLRVLIVEDEALVAMDLETMIEDSGHVVAGGARCLYSARELADDTDPNLALVDLHLARGTSGFDVSAMIQRRWPESLVVYVTANPQRVPDNLAGGHGILVKPYSRRGVAATLDFLREGLFDPPPGMAAPACFMTTPEASARWSYRVARPRRSAGAARSR